MSAIVNAARAARSGSGTPVSAAVRVTRDAGAERIAAEFEVVVVHADAVESEALGPQRGELRLERRARRDVRSAGVGSAWVGGR
jgi:hypothetical protein